MIYRSVQGVNRFEAKNEKYGLHQSFKFIIITRTSCTMYTRSADPWEMSNQWCLDFCAMLFHKNSRTDKLLLNVYDFEVKIIASILFCLEKMAAWSSVTAPRMTETGVKYACAKWVKLQSLRTSCFRHMHSSSQSRVIYGVPLHLHTKKLLQIEWFFLGRKFTRTENLIIHALKHQLTYITRFYYTQPMKPRRN